MNRIRRILRRKLTIGQPDDPCEQEADRVSDQVVRMNDAEVAQRMQSGSLQPLRIQCLETAGEGEPDRKPPDAEDEPVRPKAKGERPADDEETAQAKAAPGATTQAAAAVESHLSGLKSGGEPLDRSTRSFFESRFGCGFGSVRLHRGGLAADLSRSLRARAFTLGNHVVFGAGEFQPGTTEGRRLLGHELTHVLQQGGGISSVQRKDACGADDMEPIIDQPASFDINEFIEIPRGITWPRGSFCSNRDSVRIGIKSEWAAVHSEKNFVVKLIVLDGQDLQKQFKVGTDAKTFNVGKGSSFFIRIEVKDPQASPNLKGSLTMKYG